MIRLVSSPRASLLPEFNGQLALVRQSGPSSVSFDSRKSEVEEAAGADCACGTHSIVFGAGSSGKALPGVASSDGRSRQPPISVHPIPLHHIPLQYWLFHGCLAHELLILFYFLIPSRTLNPIPAHAEHPGTGTMSGAKRKTRRNQVNNQDAYDARKNPSRAAARTFTRDDVEKWQCDNTYIHSGYRSKGEVLVSLTFTHNETCNVYTHLIGALTLTVIAVASIRI